MLNENVFATERELARALGISKSTLSDFLSFTKIPQSIIDLIPDIHSVSKNIAVKISRIVNANPDNYTVMLALAPEVGRTITSPQKLEKYFSDKKSSMKHAENKPKVFLDKFGDKIFTLSSTTVGAPTIKIEKGAARDLDTQAFSEYIKAYFD